MRKLILERLMKNSYSFDTEFKGLSLRVEYDYDREDPATRDYPGAPAQIYINQVWVEIPEDLVSMFTQELEELCWDQVNETHEALAEARARDYLEEKRRHRREFYPAEYHPKRKD